MPPAVADRVRDGITENPLTRTALVRAPRKSLCAAQFHKLALVHQRRQRYFGTHLELITLMQCDSLRLNARARHCRTLSPQVTVWHHYLGETPLQ